MHEYVPKCILYVYLLCTFIINLSQLVTRLEKSKPDIGEVVTGINNDYWIFSGGYLRY
jgi:hypothetical protein